MEYVIAEDHALIRMMVRQILISKVSVGEKQIREVDNADDLLRIVRSDPDSDRLVIMDLVMPGKSKRVMLLRELRKYSQKARVVAYTAEESPLLAAAILTYGGLGFVTKASTAVHLIEAIRAAQEGKQYIDRRIDRTAIWGHPWLKLSEQERQIVIQLCRGRKLAEIAEESGKKLSTLRNQKSDAYKKLKVKDEIELMAFIQKHGLFYELDE